MSFLVYFFSGEFFIIWLVIWDYMKIEKVNIKN